MVTISEEIKRIVLTSPFLEEGIMKGIINLSALAREIKPQIEKSLMKPLSDSAILMALKRFSDKFEGKNILAIETKKKLGDISVRSNLMEFTFLKSDTIFEKQKRLMMSIEDKRDNFLTFTQGIYELTIISGANLKERIIESFQGERLKTKLLNLSAIIIKLPPETVKQPGVHYSILKQLAWKNINVIEVVSTFTEFIVILGRKDIDKAFSTLLNFLS
jgi:aspartokinase